MTTDQLFQFMIYIAILNHAAILCLALTVALFYMRRGAGGGARPLPRRQEKKQQEQVEKSQQERAQAGEIQS